MAQLSPSLLTIKVNLKEMTKYVVADKLFGKAIEDYGEKSSRNVLKIKEFDKGDEIIVSANIARKFERKLWTNVAWTNVILIVRIS